MATTAEILAQAIANHEAGLFPQAEELYRQIVQIDPGNARAWHLLGIVIHQRGQHEEALDCLRKALSLEPREATFHDNLGLVFQNLGRLKEAIASYRHALALQPTYFEAHRKLGNALREQGQLEEAIASYRQALRFRPAWPEALNDLGNVLQARGQLDEAIATFRRALDLRPDYAGGHLNLGNALAARGQGDEAGASYRRALLLQPDFPEAHNNLGNYFWDRGQVDEASACYREALRLRPDYPEAHQNLGNALKDQGRLDEALACYRRGLQLRPQDAAFHSNLLYTLHFCPGYDNQAIYEEHRCWNERHALPLGKHCLPHANDRTPDRRLRVGYVSPDFRAHPIGQFLLPLLEAHGQENFATFCYASVRVPDPITERCRRRAEVWRDVLGTSDEQLAQRIRADQIDILVDLTMHMENSRLLVFARKPAPVQVTYLAYCGTTGLTAIDYRFTDPYLDPPGQDERYYAERSIRLPETYWCYRPMIPTPAVNALPAAQAGQVAFGSLNNFCKVTEPTLLAWSQLLRELPEARLLLQARAGSHRARVRDFLAGHGITAERLTFLDWLPQEDYFRTYERIDLALDPFPYGGGTTTCDALWMGVPVVSLAGQTAVGRAGLSILSNVGLLDLVARDTDDYVRRAVELANDLPRLSNLRATLRERLQASPLVDAPRFARNVEAAYRKMWQAWCAGRN